MNKIYKTKYSEATNTYVAVSEHTRRAGKASNSVVRQVLAKTVLALSLGALTPIAMAVCVDVPSGQISATAASVCDFAGASYAFNGTNPLLTVNTGATANFTNEVTLTIAQNAGTSSAVSIDNGTVNFEKDALIHRLKGNGSASNYAVKLGANATLHAKGNVAMGPTGFVLYSDGTGLGLTDASSTATFDKNLYIKNITGKAIESKGTLVVEGDTEAYAQTNHVLHLTGGTADFKGETTLGVTSKYSVNAVRVDNAKVNFGKLNADVNGYGIYATGTSEVTLNDTADIKSGRHTIWTAGSSILNINGANSKFEATGASQSALQLADKSVVNINADTTFIGTGSSAIHLWSVSEGNALNIAEHVTVTTTAADDVAIRKEGSNESVINNKGTLQRAAGDFAFTSVIKQVGGALKLNNLATGELLSSTGDVVQQNTGSKLTVNNEGLMEASAETGRVIYSNASGGELAVTNTGTIKADKGYAFESDAKSTQNITNSGTIIGTIKTVADNTKAVLNNNAGGLWQNRNADSNIYRINNTGTIEFAQDDGVLIVLLPQILTKVPLVVS